MRAKNISCCFSGHRPEKLPWGSNEGDGRCLRLKAGILDAAERAYAAGYRHFLCGMARGCDTYFCEAVLALRQRRPDITVEAAVPCADQAETWPRHDRERYLALLERCDMRTVLQQKYGAGCMQRRNRYMVDHSDLLIAVHDGGAGGTRQTIAYAFSRGVDVVVLPV